MQRMKLTIELVRDFDINKYLVEGTVLQDCKEQTRHYTGIYDSMWGSYIVKVPKQFCKVITTPPMEKLLKKLVPKIKNKK